MPSTGQTLANYRIIRPIGSGGMGEVFLAEDLALERNVALKFLADTIREDDSASARLRSEAKAAAAIDNPFICKIHGIEEHAGAPFIVMEYVSGETLADVLEHQPLSSLEAVRIAIEIVEALGEAHARNIVHRDLKPANIMLTAQGHVKVMDFGLAKRVRSSHSDGGHSATKDMLTEPGMIVGTTGYMSPEQLRGQLVDPRSDIFAFGIMFYEMITGRHPFRRTSQIDTASAILNDSCPALTCEDLERGAILDGLINKMLAKNADERHQSVSDIHDVLLSVHGDSRRSLAGLKSVIESPARHEPTKAKSFVPTIAVLPFANLSADPENEYFCDGLADELINGLTKLKNLHVVARTSAFAFKGKDVDVRNIAKTLSVSNLLEGSIRKSGNRVRINVNLVEAARGFHKWSETYDREMEDIFTVQDEISKAVVTALEIQFSSASKPVFVRNYTENIEAYTNYLKARHHIGAFNESGFRKAMQCYQNAIAADDTYAPAYAGVALAYVLLGGWGVLAPAESFPTAKMFAEKAIKLDKGFDEGYRALGDAILNYDRVWSLAKKNYETALELNPNKADTHYSYSVCLECIGQHDDAIAEAKRAWELDPLARAMEEGVAWRHYHAGDLESAMTIWQQVLDKHPDYLNARMGLAAAQSALGQHRDAISTLGRTKSPEESLAPALMGHFYGLAGETEHARESLAKLERRSAQSYVPKSYRSLVHIGLGEYEEAIRLLEEAAEEREHLTLWIRSSPSFDVLRPDPRFDAILKRFWPHDTAGQ